jgi:hypothetical protein
LYFVSITQLYNCALYAVSSSSTLSSDLASTLRTRRKEVHRDQIAFVWGMSTGVNILRLTKQIRQAKLMLVFIDFSNAYKKVNRKLSFEIMQQKVIYPPEELKFIEKLFDSILLQQIKREILLKDIEDFLTRLEQKVLGNTMIIS